MRRPMGSARVRTVNPAPRAPHAARGALWLLAALLLTLLVGARGARAGDGGAPDARVDASADAEPSPEATAHREAAAHIHALIKGKLDLTLDPKGLFDVPLDDDATVALEARRLSLLLREIDAPAPAPSGVRAPPKGHARPVDAGAARDAGGPASELWEARLALDRARLSFYSLPRARRHELLAQHAKRQAEAAPPPSDA